VSLKSNKYIYERTEEHNHETELFYNIVYKGLDPFWENKVKEIIHKIRGSNSNVMHNRIIQDYPKLFLGVDDKVIPSNQSHLVVIVIIFLILV
jgi:hypothetical protein